MDRELTILDHLNRVLDSLAELSTIERLSVLQLAWVAAAPQARAEALAIPDGFRQERTRQLGILAKAMRLCRR